MSKKVTTETELRQKIMLWSEQERKQSERREQSLSSLLSLMRQEKLESEQREQRISSLLQSMRQEREQEKQTLSLAVSRMESRLSKLRRTVTKQNP